MGTAPHQGLRYYSLTNQYDSNENGTVKKYDAINFLILLDKDYRDVTSDHILSLAEIRHQGVSRCRRNGVDLNSEVFMFNPHGNAGTAFCGVNHRWCQFKT